jgi:hypothetical protein
LTGDHSPTSLTRARARPSSCGAWCTAPSSSRSGRKEYLTR